MKIAVIGALGHIGSRLVRELPNFFPGVEIVMVDNLSTQRYVSLFNLPAGASYRFIEDDVTSMDLQPYIFGVDAVVHLAALTDATKSFDQPEEMERINYSATERVANACLEAHVPMIHASSTSVYGSQNEKIDEDCDPEEINPQSPYAETKLKEETLIAEMCKSNSLRAMTFRFGTIFGTSPGMRFHTAVNKFCWQAVMGKPLTVWETAFDQKRPYLDLNDAVRAIVQVIKKNEFSGQIYNAVSVNVTVRQVIESIRNYIPSLEVEFVKSRIMNQLSFEVLNTRLLAQGFVPQGNLEEAIKQTIYLLQNANRTSIN